MRENRFAAAKESIAGEERFALKDSERLPRWYVYDLRALPIDLDAIPTIETQALADKLFDEFIRTATCFKTWKMERKNEYFRRLVHFLMIAAFQDACVRHSRDSHESEGKIKLQVVEAAIERGLVVEYRSPSGSLKQSRLIAAAKLLEHLPPDPWELDPPQRTQYVELVDRESKELIDFDQELPKAKRIQRRLDRINAVNSEYKIIYKVFDPLKDKFSDFRRLRPIHIAKFTDTFEFHGRLYASRYGHSSLRKIERATIRFNGEPCVELDYSCMHARMLYHLEEIDYQDDPYCLWGEDTTPELRGLAKQMVNALINSRSSQSAVAACNEKMRTTTKSINPDGSPVFKRGKELAVALELADAQRKAGVSFKQISERVHCKHRRITHRFGIDAGMRLMAIDSAIALEVLYHFATCGIPSLGCHDSFIVPASAEMELRETMIHYYQKHLGFPPVIR